MKTFKDCFSKVSVLICIENRTTVNRHRCIRWFLCPLCTDSELLPRLFPVEVLPDCVCLSVGLWVHPPGGVLQKQQRHLSWQHHRPLPSYTHGQVQEARLEGDQLIRVDVYLRTVVVVITRDQGWTINWISSSVTILASHEHSCSRETDTVLQQLKNSRMIVWP